jgi:hypothetical protein
MGMSTYRGYLADHLERIRDLHARGGSTRAIAEALYDAGARARSSSPYSSDLDRAGQLVNLRGMVIHIQRRLGLRTRRIRILNLRATKIETAPGDEAGAVGSSMMMIRKERSHGYKIAATR